MTKILGLITTLGVSAFAANPAIDCRNHDYRVSLNAETRELRITSQSAPLLPSLDPRITAIAIWPLPCAQTLGKATVCFSNVCRYEKFYDAAGMEITDIETSGEVSFTALPEMTGNQSRYLRTRFELNEWYRGKKYIVSPSFETSPLKDCQ